MPEIDENLFRWLTLGGIALGLLLTLATLSTLARIAKGLRDLTRAPEEQADRSEAGTASGTEEASSDESGGSPALEKSGSTPKALEEQEPIAAAEVEPHPAEPHDEPFQRDGRWWFKRDDELLLYDEQSGEWRAADAPPGNEPQVPVVTGPTEPATALAADGVPTGDAPAEAQSVVSGAEAQDPGSEAAFWRCPACGVVNGLTAATCRMCFATKP